MQVTLVWVLWGSLSFSFPFQSGADRSGFAGSWVRDAYRGDANYIIGEYPEMRMDVAVNAASIRITQTVGSVRNGISLPGSGDTTHAYELRPDGIEREIPSLAGKRLATASWEGPGLRFVHTYVLEDPDTREPVRLRFSEIWELLDEGRSLRITRESGSGSRTKVSQIFYERPAR